MTHRYKYRNLLGMRGALIMAGGQGTRLGHSGPKGTFPVGPNGETLFELLAKRVEGRLGIMTSPLTHEETVRHFREKDLKADFFVQGMTEEGPEGNGTLLWHFWESGVADLWSDVEVMTIQPVDNVLANPFDERMFECEEVVVKATPRLAGEQTGLIVQEGERVRVIEYSELEEEREGLASLSLFSVTREFSKVVAERTEEMPWHEAIKNGRVRRERFIFDMLEFAQKVKILVCPREECFAPLKRPEDVKSVQEALL